MRSGLKTGAEGARAGRTLYGSAEVEYSGWSVKLLLTSSGISDPSIEGALVDLLGKPIAESSALIVPTAIYPFPEGAGGAWRAISGQTESPLSG